MDSARFAINSDNDFYLDKLPTLNGLLESGITLFVVDEFPQYNDMTLVQYAIAKRKPKCLKLMLDILMKIKKFDEIMFPKTSNTRGSLLQLAIEFGSRCKIYDEVDNSCLIILMDTFFPNKDGPSINVDLGNQVYDTPLIKAIRSKNLEAISLLMKRGANIFHPLNDKDNTIDISRISEMPAMVLFKLYDNINELKEVFGYIKKACKQLDLSRFNQIKVEDGDEKKDLADVLHDYYHLDAAKNYILSYAENDDSMDTLKNDGSSNTEKIQPDPNPQPKECRCSFIIDGKPCLSQLNMAFCEECKKWFCGEHIESHGC